MGHSYLNRVSFLTPYWESYANRFQSYANRFRTVTTFLEQLIGVVSIIQTLLTRTSEEGLESNRGSFGYE